MFLVAVAFGVAAALEAGWIRARWAAVGLIVIALELLYVGSGYVLSPRRPRDAIVALLPVVGSVVGGLWVSRRTLLAKPASR